MLLTAQLPVGVEGLELHKEAPWLAATLKRSVGVGPAEVGRERKWEEKARPSLERAAQPPSNSNLKEAGLRLTQCQPPTSALLRFLQGPHVDTP